MKVIMYMAISVNGMIAKEEDNTSWITKEEWDAYSKTVRKAGNLIVGRRTYNILTKQPEFSEFKDVRIAVVSKDGNFKVIAQNHFVANSPDKALKLLNNSKEIVVAGGGILNNSFLEENLVDEIYLDVEPIILSKGIPIFNGNYFEKSLELLGQSKISDNEIQLHYKIIK